MAASISAPLAQADPTFGLLRQPRPLTCYDLPTLSTSTVDAGISTTFAQAAKNGTILSVGTLFAARTSYISQRPLSRPFEFVDASWSRTVGADRVQADYLRDRTFAYVWIRVPGFDPSQDVAPQIAGSANWNGRTEREQVAALASSYRPLLSCNDQVLLRSR